MFNESYLIDEDGCGKIGLRFETFRLKFLFLSLKKKVSPAHSRVHFPFFSSPARYI